MMIGKAYNIPTIALRFFNEYGTRQSLSNPYTGVRAIFASKLLNNNSPVIYEDRLELSEWHKRQKQKIKEMKQVNN